MKLCALAWLGLTALSSVVVNAHPAAVPTFPLAPVKTEEVAKFPLAVPPPRTGNITHPPAPINLPAVVKRAWQRRKEAFGLGLHEHEKRQAAKNLTVASTILVIVRDTTAAVSATSGLNAYGIPYQVLIVPQAGVALPVLNTTAGGNFGGIIIASQVSYDYGGTIGWTSALTQAQYNTLYAYQTTYGVRMVQYDAYPQPVFGTTALGGCCDYGVEHDFIFTNTTGFTQAGLKTNAAVSTFGLYHFPASITDPATTWEIAQFKPNGQFTSKTTAGVINNFSGRQQMVFFISWATEWSMTSNYIQHAYITWLTRGLYAGYRRVNFNTQIDDMFLSTPIYKPTNGVIEYRTTKEDMAVIAAWVPKVRAKMNTGSIWRPELAHNGNGNIIQAQLTTAGQNNCGDGPIDVGDYPTTPLEFQKTLGTGESRWPTSPATYNFAANCVNEDPLKVWFGTAANRDAFMHMSHTFTHYHLNNATTSDVYKEITFNQAWLRQIGLTSGTFSPNALVPPAITGCRNGDAISGWVNAGLTNVVGDNSRPTLRNQVNQMWPYITTNASNGYAGFTVLPRWPTRIYYNCDTPDCTLQEWIDTSAGTGDFANLMKWERQDTMRYFFGLYHDGYMFHQANLRATNVAAITNPDGSTVTSIFQAWVEMVVNEFSRLVNWPLVGLKQTDLSTSFLARMQRDACGYRMSWNKTPANKITGFTVTATGNTCAATIPITIPAALANYKSMTQEKVGNDPITVWVKLSGAAQSFDFATAINV